MALFKHKRLWGAERLVVSVTLPDSEYLYLKIGNSEYSWSKTIQRISMSDSSMSY